MAYNTDGSWSPEDDSVEGKLSKITSDGSALQDQARAGAADYAASRGLLNSSMAAGAGESAVLQSALPIASQDANQTAAKNLQQQQAGTQLQIAGENVASNDRQQSLGAIASFGNAYTNALDSISNNPNIPENTRNNYLTNIANLRDNDISFLQQLYGINLTGGTPTAFAYQ